MENKKPHISLRELEVYKLARQLSKLGWDIYSQLGWQDKKIIGDQFITATDSFGANISEGYNRYYFLEKIKFFYTARASLTEANDYWLELLKERNKIDEAQYDSFGALAVKSSIKLNNFISAIYKAKKDQ